MHASELIKLLKRLAIRAIIKTFGERGQIWLESESMIRRLKKGYYWEKEIGLLKHLVSPGDICLDVGANCGQWTYWMSKQVGPSGKVIAIEPVPMTALVLGRVADMLRLTNVEIQQIAVGDRNCQIEMLIAENEFNFKSLPTARILAHGEASDSDSITVNMVTLTSLVGLLGIEKVNFIKCDIEGAEMQFFQGGQSILIRDKPAIICEIERKHTVQFGYTPDDLFGFLESLGYKSFAYASSPMPDQVQAKALVPVKGLRPYAINYIFLHKSDESTLEFLNRTGKRCPKGRRH